MSLATRCTSCGTVFRVVQDQLKVSDGWVRCGRCNEVFSALEGLFDLDPAPAPASPPAPEAATHEALAPRSLPDAASSEAAPAPGIEEAEPEGFIEPYLDEQPVVALPTETEPELAPTDSAADEAEPATVSLQPAQPADDGPRVPDVPNGSADDAFEPAPLYADPPAPGFVRQAERQAQWERPRTVVALALLSLVLMLALAAQAAIQLRDLLAAAVPPLQPALQALCDVAACRIEPLRRIDDIGIESSALTAAPGGEAARLSVALRNRGALPLAMPAIELTLTDIGGQVLARRVLSPSDFAVVNPTLAAASESSLQLVLATPGLRASGYTIEPFYP